jgi:cell wall-associated NlpC family hydrolase
VTLPRTRRAALLVVAAGLAAALTAAPGGPASADQSIASAQAKAKAIAAQVATLQTQVEVATEQYDAVQEQLAGVVTQYLNASQNVGDLADEAQLQRQQNVARIQALYKAGGQLGLLAEILDGGDINDVLSRYVAVTHVLAADNYALSHTNTQVSLASSSADALSTLADQRAALQAQAQVAQARIIGLLAERQDQLDAANSTVRQLVVAEQERQAAAAAAAAARTLGTDPFAPTTLPAGTPAAIVTAITAARTALGDPYQWGATGPSTYDCSGLTQWAYAQAGITLPRTSREQWFSGPHPALDALLPGDLLFRALDPNDAGTIHHVAIYLGGGYMIEAPHTGAVVHVVPVYLDGYFGATRPVPTGSAGPPSPAGTVTTVGQP